MEEESDQKKFTGYICTNPWTTLFVWGNGDVTHCCYSNIGSLGNINKNSLKDIWNGKKLIFVRGNIAQGKYIEAGCEHFCRSFRWNKFYGSAAHFPEIPEGLARIKDFDKDILLNKALDSPAIIGIATDWKCNFKCTHCQAPRNTAGVTQNIIRDIWPAVENTKVVRIVDGEFTVNQESLNLLFKISQLKNHPIVFMNTNGHISVDKYLPYIENLESFHLKFSLEGLGDEYERTRIGGNWDNFEANLMRAKEIFDAYNRSGHDWRLYLNYCVMRSNFSQLTDVVRFATEHNIRLVVNSLNGAKHIKENIALYEHLRIPEQEINDVISNIHQIINESHYFFGQELKQHLDYIVRIIRDEKLNIPQRLVPLIYSIVKDKENDRFLYMLYKWKIDKKSLSIYLYRKIWKRIRAYFININRKCS